jgi:hypothetical protein
MSKSLKLPPYGYVNADNAAFLAKRPVPLGFRLKPDDGPVASAEGWEKWRDSLADEMASFLWPIYKLRGWSGKAVTTAMDLTEADLEIMRAMQPKMEQRIQGGGKPTGRQADAWLREDEAAPGATFEYYQSKFPAMLQTEMAKAIVIGGIDIARPASQGLKQLFQRPRPFQVAMMLRQKNPIVVQASRSAITPAMISGHCIQGTLALAQVQAALGEVLDSSPGLADDVQRFLVDTGDRRVYAGLHYPSDNVGSWFAALSLCDHVFGEKAKEIRRVLWHAITTHSEVYKALEQTGGVYADPLKRLKSAAG